MHSSLATRLAWRWLAAAALSLACSAHAFEPAPIVWAPCAENTALDCGTLSLPVDHQHADGERFEMAVMRARTTNAERRIGVLFTNPGGPGNSGIDALLGGIKANAPIVTRLRERFDLIAFDPRGVQRSRAVRCDIEFDDVPPEDSSDAALAVFFDSIGRRYAEACAQGSGRFVFTLGVNAVARDMDWLRRALGESQISYIGLSFGTQLGAVYASMFPERVRAMVLDGGVTPGTDGNALLDFWLEHAAGFDAAFAQLDRLCRQDSDCALHGVGVVRAFDALLAQLKTTPMQSDGRTLTAHTLGVLVGGALYRESAWPAIVGALVAARNGDAAPLWRLARAPANGGSRPQATVPMLCGTYATRLPAAVLLPHDAAFAARQPRFAARALRFASLRHQIVFATALCNAWPQAEPVFIRDLSRELARPPLVIGNRFDNATPLAWSERLAAALGFPQALLQYEGGGHGVATSGNACTDDAIVAYLTALRSPEPGSRCAAKPLQFAPPMP
jgi:pimeloyl-ACP methyl ester carboxylesterase